MVPIICLSMVPIIGAAVRLLFAIETTGRVLEDLSP